MTYGVAKEGFNRKPLGIILQDIETGAEEVFGTEVVQTSQSPLGQLNGLMADLAADLWQLAEDIYQAHDVDQAEGTRLDSMAKLRLLRRSAGELDADLRKSITNIDRARIDVSDLETALKGISGVTYAKVFVNDSDSATAEGVPPHTVAVAVIGGDDQEVAMAVRNYVVPGVGSYGNTSVEIIVDGFCRTVVIIRPEEVNLELEINISANQDFGDCPTPSVVAMQAALAQAFVGFERPRNGQDVTEFLIRRQLECLYKGVEVISVEVAEVGDPLAPAPFALSFFQIMKVLPENIEIVAV